MCYTISATKANHLFWLGRYVERAYLSLHLLRRYYDKMIEDDSTIYEEFYSKLDAINPYRDKESFQKGSLYDMLNPCSVLSILELVNDNAIVLREEISTETLSYVQLSQFFIKKMQKEGVVNITNLQPITDYLLAFWGSIDERVFDERVRNILRAGRLIENIDMHIRFDYPYSRIQEAFDSLRVCTEVDSSIFDIDLITTIEEQLSDEAYANRDSSYKFKLLKLINNIVLI